MLYEKLTQSGIHRGVFALLLGIMWLMPIVVGWMAYEAAHTHMKFLFAASGGWHTKQLTRT